VFVQRRHVSAGDRSRHIAVLHLPQLLYFAGFACVLQPALTVSVVWRHSRSAMAALAKARNALPSLSLLLLVVLSVHYCTYTHPFLLSDNRHFTFYIWKNLFQRFVWFRYCLAPFYVLAICILSTSLSM
jgi:alpha-1,2-glucosyltransferase